MNVQRTTNQIPRPILEFAAIILLCGCGAEFGDAPDNAPTNYPVPFAQTGQFPTLDASGGAQADDVSQATLGPTASEEADANDPADPDGQPNLNPSNTDSDDGIVNFVVILTSIPPPAQMTVNVNGPAGSPGGQFFVNVLIDMNMNGQWDSAIGGGVNEWAVINFPVTVTPGTSQDVALPPFPFGNGNLLPDGAWMRIALTDSLITAAPWAGGGDFTAGEIEDHVIDLPAINEGEDDEKRVAIPVMECPDRVLFNGMPQVQFPCRITNTGPAGDVGYRLTRQDGGVQVVGPPIDPNPGVIPGMAPGQVNNLLFTATRREPLPSNWEYRAWGQDPQSVVKAGGVVIGYEDSSGETEFDDEGIEQRQQREYREGE